MAKNTMEELADFGQSVWLDSISRSMFKTGSLNKWIDQGLRGMTSNPTIFDKAVGAGGDYDDQIKKLKAAGKSTFEIYDELTTTDVRDAADAFRKVHDRTGGLDGYVSLEINPKLAYKARETIEEGLRLRREVDRPNVMFKVPATKPGFEAVEELTAAGVNVNITLIFSTQQHRDTASAYLRGIRRYLKENGDPARVRSVASIFVSRIDTDVDELLENAAKLGTDEARKFRALALRGKAGVANCGLSYAHFLETFRSEGFRELEKSGVNLQRVLWGSTSTKNPAYSDIKYVTELIAKDTVNTMPEKTLKAFLDHGVVEEALTAAVSEAEGVIKGLDGLGISIDKVCADLLDKGVRSFEKSFDDLLATIEKKAR